MQQFTDHLLFQGSYVLIFGLTIVYFLLLYFGLGYLFLQVCRNLHRRKILQRIAPGEASREQIRFEIRNALLPIGVFGISGMTYVYSIRHGWISLKTNDFSSVLFGVVLLTLWNEVHFFCVHRLMHVRFFMRHVHHVHHRSHIPTVYSVYSFHWFEALLLSTVPLTLGVFMPLAPLAVFVYPLASILLNYAGHCNFRFGSGNGPQWTRIGTRHAGHHFEFRKTYGFASYLLDRLSGIFNSNQSN